MMAQDKRGQIPEPQIEDSMDELDAGTGEDFVAGPTSRNSVGDAKRAAAKATGLMGASTKLDPELDMSHVDDGRVKSGSSAGIRSFAEVPSDGTGSDVRLTLSNEEVAGIVPTTVLEESRDASGIQRGRSQADGDERRRREPSPRAGARDHGGRVQGKADPQGLIRRDRPRSQERWPGPAPRPFFCPRQRC